MLVNSYCDSDEGKAEINLVRPVAGGEGAGVRPKCLCNRQSEAGTLCKISSQQSKLRARLPFHTQLDIDVHIFDSERPYTRDVCSGLISVGKQ